MLRAGRPSAHCSPARLDQHARRSRWLRPGRRWPLGYGPALKGPRSDPDISSALVTAVRLTRKMLFTRENVSYKTTYDPSARSTYQVSTTPPLLEIADPTTTRPFQRVAPVAVDHGEDDVRGGGYRALRRAARALGARRSSGPPQPAPDGRAGLHGRRVRPQRRRAPACGL